MELDPLLLSKHSLKLNDPTDIEGWVEKVRPDTSTPYTPQLPLPPRWRVSHICVLVHSGRPTLSRPSSLPPEAGPWLGGRWCGWQGAPRVMPICCTHRQGRLREHQWGRNHCQQIEGAAPCRHGGQVRLVAGGEPIEPAGSSAVWAVDCAEPLYGWTGTSCQRHRQSSASPPLRDTINAYTNVESGGAGD